MDETVVDKKVAPESDRHSAFIRWIINHDSSIWFNVFYIGLAVVLSIWLGLFWLVAVVGAHGVIEFYRQYLLHSRGWFAFAETIWEIKLDIGLIVFAFWLGVYLDFIFGITGLSAGARMAAQAGGRVAQTGTRVAVWQRTIRGIFITLDDVGLAFKALANRKKKKPDEIDSDAAQAESMAGSTVSSWCSSYSKGDWLSLAFVLVFFLLIVVAPFITGKSFAEVWHILVDEMQPFP